MTSPFSIVAHEWVEELEQKGISHENKQEEKNYDAFVCIKVKKQVKGSIILQFGHSSKKIYLNMV